MTLFTRIQSVAQDKRKLILFSIIKLCCLNLVSSFFFTSSFIEFNHCRRFLPDATTNCYSTIININETHGPLKPLNDYILVRPKIDSKNNECRIIFPDENKGQSTLAEVIAVGPGKLHPHTGIRIDNPVNVGMLIIYGAFDGTELKYHNQDLKVLRGEDVMLFCEGSLMTKDNVEPSRDYVLVRPYEKATKSRNGLFFSNLAMKKEHNKPNTGTVFKVGKGRVSNTGKIIKPPVRFGEKVKFKSYSGIEVSIEGEKWIIVKTTDILCISNS